MLNVKKCMCWCLPIIELKNALWNIEISSQTTLQESSPKYYDELQSYFIINGIFFGTQGT